MIDRKEEPSALELVAADNNEFVTFRLFGQLLGIPVLVVHDVLNAQKITRIPLAPESVVGVLNLRGKIVTAIDLRIHLGFPHRQEDDPPPMSVVVEQNGEPYSLLVDSVGEVISVSNQEFESNPVTLDDRLRAVSQGIYRQEKDLLVIIDVDKLLSFDQIQAA